MEGNQESERMFYLKPLLREALAATSRPYLYREILTLLKNYIFTNRQIMTPNPPYNIDCAGTSLGKAFNVDRFVKDDVRYLILKNTIEVPSSSSVEKMTNNSKDGFPVVITLPDTPTALSGPESERSFQGYETALCRDSDSELSDSSAASPNDGPEQPNSSAQPEVEEAEEYELVTESDVASDGSDSDEEEAEIDSDLILIMRGLSDQEGELIDSCFADESDSSSESDHSISDDEPDQWKCLMCGVHNKPFVRYCAKCWQLRKDWFPDPPKRKKKRKPRPKKVKRKFELPLKNDDRKSIDEASEFPSQTPSTSSTLDPSLSIASSSAGSFSSQDSGVFEEPPLYKKRLLSGDVENTVTLSVSKKQKPGTSFTDEKDNAKEKLKTKLRKYVDTPQCDRWLETPQSRPLLEEIDNISSGESEPEQETKLPLSDNNCTICFLRPKNASIIHGKISHIGFCYPCVRRLHKSNARCPVCRRKILMITRNSFV